MTDLMSDYTNSFQTMELSNGPDYVVIDCSDIITAFEEMGINSVGLDNLTRSFHLDFKNIIMDLFEDICERPLDVRARVNIELLRLAPYINSSQQNINIFNICCSRAKNMIWRKIVDLNFKAIMKADGGHFSFYVHKTVGNTVILKHFRTGQHNAV